MKPTDFATYLEAKNHTTYILDNADKIREYLQLNGKWGKLMARASDFTHPLFNAASGLIHKVNKSEPISFNPNTVNGELHIKMIDGFVDATDLVADDKIAIIKMATKQPFAGLLEVEYDQLRTNELLNTPTEPLNIFYGAQDSTESKYTRGSSHEISKLIFILKDPSPVTCEYEVFVSYDDTGKQEYTERPTPFKRVVIADGETRKAIDVKFAFRHSKIRVVCKTSGAYNVIVSNA